MASGDGVMAPCPSELLAVEFDGRRFEVDPDEDVGWYVLFILICTGSIRASSSAKTD